MAAVAFKDLGVADWLVEALTALSVTRPSEIQTQCIPPLLAGRDCLGGAKTGSGKTIAFAVPILQRLALDPVGGFALVLTPTRELAFQISDQFKALGRGINLRLAQIVGGLDMLQQTAELQKRPHVIVATPGRLVDFIKSSGELVQLERLKFLVLDEADRLLSNTFAPHLECIFQKAGDRSKRQTLLFTATMTDALLHLSKTSIRNGKTPFIHQIKSEMPTVETLDQYYSLTPARVKVAYLFYLLLKPPSWITVSLPKKSYRQREEQTAKRSYSDVEDLIPRPPLTIIFVGRCVMAELLVRTLKSLKVRCVGLHSLSSQPERLEALAKFRAGGVIQVMVTTDVGSRGLDIPMVQMVINFNMPLDPNDYIHRVGRTARAGQKGTAISFIDKTDVDRLKSVEGRLGKELERYDMSELKVLEHLNRVSEAQRGANMAMHDENFGEKKKVREAKQLRKRRLSER